MKELLMLLCVVGVGRSAEQCPTQRSWPVKFSVNSWRNDTGHRITNAEMHTVDFVKNAVTLMVDQWTERCYEQGTVILRVSAISKDNNQDENGKNNKPETTVSTNNIQTIPKEITSSTTPVPLTTVRSSGYENFPGHGYYKLYKDRVIWKAAQESCKKDGAHLVVAESEDEFKKLIGKYGYGPWMGIYRKNSEEEWITVLDQRVADLNYDVWRNHGQTGGDCIMMSHSSYNTDPFFSVHECNENQNFICELN